MYFSRIKTCFARISSFIDGVRVTGTSYFGNVGIFVFICVLLQTVTIFASTPPIKATQTDPNGLKKVSPQEEASLLEKYNKAAEPLLFM